MRGIVYWNSHAFNLTDEDFVLNGRLNFVFAKEQRYPGQCRSSTSSNVFRPNAAPFTIETYCAKHVLPQGTRLFVLTSHTHKRGKRFWVTAPDGSMIYENFIYNDPDRSSPSIRRSRSIRRTRPSARSPTAAPTTTASPTTARRIRRP